MIDDDGFAERQGRVFFLTLVLSTLGDALGVTSVITRAILGRIITGVVDAALGQFLFHRIGGLLLVLGQCSAAINGECAGRNE